MTAGILIGVLATLCVALVVIVLILRAQNKKKEEVIGGMGIRFSEIVDLIKNTPRNVIHLSLKPLNVDAGLPLFELPIRPENFVINVDKLKKLLLNKLKTENHPNPDTRAYCILDHSGIGSMVSSEMELRKPLTILLINEDMKGAKQYLEMIAESICAEMAALPGKTKEP